MPAAPQPRPPAEPQCLPDADAIIEACARGLRAEENRWLVEQSARGLDSLSEVEVHPVLAAGLSAAGLGVLREQPYPAEWRGRQGRRKPLPDDTDRRRCDLVILARPRLRLRDGLASARAVEADRTAAAGTLFAPLGPEPLSATTPAAVEPEDAYWLEVKVVGQHAFCEGVPGANPAYASELVRGVGGDIRKLRDDAAIVRCGVLLVLLVADGRVADHDVAALAHACLDKNLPIRSPRTRRVPITDRIGNGVCEVCLIEVAK